MTIQHLRRTGLAALATGLVLPAVAAAHPAAWEITPLVTGPGSPAPAPNPANAAPADVLNQADLLAGAKQVAAYNHNNTKVFVESNGRADGGLLNFRLLPGPYRSQVPKSQWFAEAGTGIQAHDTCEVPALQSEPVVLEWQEADPFWTYIPFQAASAQLDDDPASWLGIVQRETGVDLTALGTQAEREAACEALPGATDASFRKADTISATTNSLFTFLTNPLQAQITSLGAERTALQGEVATLQGEKASLEAQLAAAKLANTTLSLVPRGTPTVASLTGDGLTVDLTGPAGRPVAVRIVVTDARRKAMRLKRRRLGGVTVTLGADAKGTATVKLSSTAAKAVKAAKGALSVSIDATSGDRFVARALKLGS